jgi:transcriptional regulator with XRE-family HTH domain
MARMLTRGQLKTRLLRALSGLSQDEFERETQVENVAGIECGPRRPTASQIARMCAVAGLTPAGCEALILEYEAHATHTAHHRGAAGSPRPKRLPDPEHVTGITAIIEAAEARISRHGEERRARRAAERELARDSWDRAKGLGFADVALLARATREYQSWALVELICDESTEAGERARDLAGLAVEMAGHVRGAEGWCRRLLGFALAHLASARHAAGDPGAARDTLTEAERLWKSGEDPDRVLDAGRFSGLKASLKARQAYPA